MGTLLARNADVLVTMDGERRELRNAGLFARDGIIEQVGPTASLPGTADVVLDLAGHILLPGLINCHHHLDQILTRNLPAAQNTNLFPWLMAHYRIWARRTPEDTRTAVLIGCGELAPCRAAPPCSTTPTCFRTDAGSMTRSRPRPSWAFASSPRAAACRSVNHRAGCRPMIAWRPRTRSCATACA